MYEWMDALKIEIEAQSLRLTRTPFGAALTDKLDRVNDAYTQGLSRIGETSAGSKLGSSSRKAVSWLAELPILSLTPDVIARTHCLDLHAAEVRGNPNDPMRLIQFAEALEASRRDWMIIRAVRSADPVSAIASKTLRDATSLNAEDPVDKLLRKASVIMKRRGAKSFDDWYCWARLYRLTGKPNSALICARSAADVARSARHEIPEPSTFGERLSDGWVSGGVFGWLGSFAEATVDAADRAANRIETDHFTGEFDLLEPRELLAKQEGAALATMAWAFMDKGDESASRTAAERSLELGFTVGCEVQAALVDTSGAFIDRLVERRRLLSESNRGDRIFYRGKWRGVMGVAGSVAEEQFDKATRVWNRLTA